MSYKIENEKFFADERSEPFGDAADRLRDVLTDVEMRDLLESWKAPPASSALDHRVMTAYRKQISAPFWKRALASSIRVPLPVAAAVVLLILASAFLSLRSIRSSTHQVMNYEPPQIKIVEAPVTREKIVTRIVYVQKRRGAKSNQARNQYLAKTLSDDKTIARSEESSGQYFTVADLTGFQPVRQIKIEVIKGEKPNEN